MIDLALKARLPMVGVTCDDPIHMEDVLQSIAGTVQHVEGKIPTNLWLQDLVFWTEDHKMGTSDLFLQLQKKEKTLVFLNCPANPLVFNCGELVPGVELLASKIDFMGGSPLLLSSVKGLGLQAVERLLAITSARYGDLTIKHVRDTRSLLGQAAPGLYPMDTELGFYEPYPKLVDWLQINAPYFLSESAHPKLVPRGLLFEGAPGTGKTMAARYIARTLQVPLYQLDIGTTLSRWAGQSEDHLRQTFSRLDREAPCVVLIDEVEKVFTTESEGGVVDRMLASSLWWLSEHTSRVLTVMTSNDVSRVPPPLYRPGRINARFKVGLMTAQEATAFAHRLLVDLMDPIKPKLTILQQVKFDSSLGSFGWSHAEVSNTVFDLVKKNQWLGS